MARMYATGQTFLDGALGHHGYALQDLADFVDALRLSGEDDLDLIVTGDLTRTGGLPEFQNAQDFLYGDVDLNPPLGNLVGLRMGYPLSFVIPGNHDHWDGDFIAWGAAPSRYSAYFQHPLPSFHSRQLANGRSISFVLVNSDADVSPFGYERPLAHGSFISELRHPALQFRQRSIDEIRAMLIHHSWYRRGKTLRMNVHSRRELERYLVNNSVRAILTGHTHGPLLDFFTINPELYDVYELRAGTATQLDETPVSWRTVWGTLPTRKWEPNSLLVHRLFVDQHGATIWHAQAYQRSVGSGFLEITTPGSSLNFQV